ncbi:carboxylesterase/lipase family protein [Herbiconiux sp. P18]|uniref:carboxylesterase/lipase family protein n=1 Tax=Herbiconiux liangxiaofengii TaxID=3342795 RepID=UPI0035B7F514
MTTSAPELDVTTTHGVVRGIRDDSLIAWRGIPFAAPPVGTRRFQAPTPPEPWPGVLDASAFGPAPIQADRSATEGGAGDEGTSEDSLTINVLRPATPSVAPRPVMVWIHGGAYQFGASSFYQGKHLAHRADAVFVSFNYRVNAFGFLDLSRYSTPERPFDTNIGLRDQVAALQWVRENIARFGGDPDDVTLFGESAGAISVTTLMCVPSAAGLFHRAIAQSSAPASVYRRERAQKWAEQFLDLLGRGDHGVADRLTEASPEEILAAATRLAELHPREQPGTLSMSPVVDGDFLPERPLEAFRNGTAARIPLIIGTNAAEGALFQFLSRKKDVPDIPVTAPSIESMFGLTDPSARERVVANYPGYPSKKAAAQLGGDIVFWYPSVAVAEAHSQYAPTWVYRLDYATPLMRLAGLGATHGTDIAFVFGTTQEGRGVSRLLGGGRASLGVSAAMMARWVAFVLHDDPADDWPQFDEASRQTLIIDQTLRVESDPRGAARAAWSTYRNWDDPVETADSAELRPSPVDRE